VSKTPAIPSPNRGRIQPPAGPRRVFQIIRIGVPFLGLCLLAYLALNGRYQALRQARLDDIILIRSRLLRSLDDGAEPSNAEVRALLSSLKARLVQLDSDFASNHRPPDEELEVRLTKAAVANAEQKFSEALSLLKDVDEKGASGGTNRFMLILQVRGDSFLGLRDCANALTRYRQILAVQPQNLPVLERLAHCHFTLGHSNEATTAYRDLERACHVLGDEALVQGRTEAARRHQAKAIEILTRLVEREGHSDLVSRLTTSLDRRGLAYLLQRKADAAGADFQKAIDLQAPRLEPGQIPATPELARLYVHRGNALLLQGTSDAARDHFTKAIAIQSQVASQPGGNEIDFDLAASHQNRGNVFLIQEKPEMAIADFEQAIQILSRRLNVDGRTELSIELARCHNNRGVVHRGQGNLDAAAQDFERAIDLLAYQKSGGATGETTKAGAGIRAPDVKLDVSMNYTENAIEALVRTRLTSQPRSRERPVLLGVSLRNRGYVHLVRGNINAAVTNFIMATEIYAGLVNQEGETDLVPQFVRSLSSLARTYATHPEPSSRDALKAKQYALRAWDLSQGKAYLVADTLAVACAESGSFPEAVQWQEKALALAPAKYQAEVRARLALYKAGKTYRVPGSGMTNDK
jgi:tetratricopeptide (TPR) repeat protein